MSIKINNKAVIIKSTVKPTARCNGRNRRKLEDKSLHFFRVKPKDPKPRVKQAIFFIDDLHPMED
jgi:hypothetical protein